MNKELKVYLYQTKYSDATVTNYEFRDDDDDYVMLAKPSTVTFEMLDREVVLKSRLDALDRQITEVRAVAQAKVDDLEDQKQRLMAITSDT